MISIGLRQRVRVNGSRLDCGTKVATVGRGKDRSLAGMSASKICGGLQMNEDSAVQTSASRAPGQQRPVTGSFATVQPPPPRGGQPEGLLADWGTELFGRGGALWSGAAGAALIIVASVVRSSVGAKSALCQSYAGQVGQAQSGSVAGRCDLYSVLSTVSDLARLGGAVLLVGAGIMLALIVAGASIPAWHGVSRKSDVEEQKKGRVP